MEPMTSRAQEQLLREFSADCVSEISNTSAFARELGGAFAAHSSWSDVDLTPWDKLMRQLRPTEFGDKVVWVYHGPVLYTNNAEKIVESFPVRHRAAVVAFMKRERLIPS